MNAFLEKMGYGPQDKVLITHIDDIGFSHAANVGSFACLDVGAATCGSVLVNGPWFREAVDLSKQRPDVDIGVHLTLTCEYPTFRWGPLSTRDPASGLMDSQGYMWHTREDAVRHVTVAAAEAEMRAQIEIAFAAGLDVTHIDTHMGTVVHPKFLSIYLNLAREFGVPAFLPNVTRDRLEQLSEGEMAEEFLALLTEIDAGSVPMLDEIIIDTLRPMTDKKAFYRELVDSVEPGLTHLLFHPAQMGDELAAIDQRASASRHADFEAFTDPSLRTYIERAGCQLIGYQALKRYL